MVSRETCGYDYEFLDPIPEECTCLICTQVQREAQQVTCCGKIYCKSCLEQLRKKGDYFLCPNCRANLKGDYKYFTDKNTIRKIKQLRIQCANKSRGCQWVGLLRDLEEQHLFECPNEIVYCAIKKGIFSKEVCGLTVQRYQLEKHMAEDCEWREVTCPHCGKSGSYNDIIKSNHVELECPDVLIPCKNEGCPVKIKRCLMNNHYEVCPKAEVSCQYYSIGCSTRLKREDELAHEQKSMKNHLEYALETIRELRSEVKDFHCDIGPNIRTVIHIPLLEKWYEGSPFYASVNGCKIIPRAGIMSTKGCTGVQLLVEVAAMPGRYDSDLRWPVKSRIKVELRTLEQNNYGSSCTTLFTLSERAALEADNRSWIRVANFSVHLLKSYITGRHSYKYLNDNSAHLAFCFLRDTWLY